VRGSCRLRDQFKHGVFLVEVTVLLFYPATDDKSTEKQQISGTYKIKSSKISNFQRLNAKQHRRLQFIFGYINLFMKGSKRFKRNPSLKVLLKLNISSGQYILPPSQSAPFTRVKCDRAMLIHHSRIISKWSVHKTYRKACL